MEFLNSQMDLAEFIRRFGKPYDPATDDYRRPPFASPVKAGKATAIYNAHSYHTKVPPQGIEPYILHYTNPGDIVLDPFCGSGMAGVAALKLGRRVILNDLSPAASHIAYNYCSPVDVITLQREFEIIKTNVKDEFDWLYGTNCDRCGGKAIIQFTVWSDILECNRCGKEIVLWDVAVNRNTGVVSETFYCPQCSKELKKLGLKKLPRIPVLTVYECTSCKPSRGEHSVTSEEKSLLLELARNEIPYFIPNSEINKNGPQYHRSALGNRNISSVMDFYTKRNLWALARIRNEISKVENRRIAEALLFVFTASLVRATATTRYMLGKSGNAPISGTIYFPSLSTENNILALFERKFDDCLAYFKESSNFQLEAAIIINSSATDLPNLLSDQIDYIFSDPPFGSNIYYSELNNIWESWLGKFTITDEEAVVHRKQDNGYKQITDYARLMEKAFFEMFRLLKPGRWASIVFHNSDNSIWQVILQAAASVGFEVEEVNAFDKEQLTFKGIRGDKGLERVTNKDIVLNLRKPNGITTRRPSDSVRNGEAEARIAQGIAYFLGSNPPPEKRTLQHFWNVVLYDMLAEGVVDVSMEKVGAILPHYFKQIDGRWYLRGETVAGGNVFDLKSDTGAIAWLNAVLSSKPQTIGDLIPNWQSTTATMQGGDVEPGRLERLLEQNFWLDKRTNRWRLPTSTEREQMSAAQDISAQAHLRTIRRFLEDEGDQRPNTRELAAWIQFTYNRGAYSETIKLYDHLDESQLEPDYAQSIRKMVQVSRLKAKI